MQGAKGEDLDARHTLGLYIGNQINVGKGGGGCYLGTGRAER